LPGRKIFCPLVVTVEVDRMTTRIPSTTESSPERKLAPQSFTNIPLGLRIGLSVALLLHLAAVFLPPFQFACRVGNGSSSPFADWLISPLRPYVTALYLDHGYFFFAPNPGPSHLVHYKVEFDDGREPIEGRFPDLKAQQPRLKYHRHFMIAEALNNQFTSPTPPPEPSPPPLNVQQSDRDRRIHADLMDAHKTALREWQFRRRQYDEMRKSMEEHLLSVHGGSKVTLTRVEHRLLTPFEVEELGLRPNDPDTYLNLPEGDSVPGRGAPGNEPSNLPASKTLVPPTGAKP
jgi:hypothetical protein